MTPDPSWPSLLRTLVRLTERLRARWAAAATTSGWRPLTLVHRPVVPIAYALILRERPSVPAPSARSGAVAGDRDGKLTQPSRDPMRAPSVEAIEARWRWRDVLPTALRVLTYAWPSPERRRDGAHSPHSATAPATRTHAHTSDLRWSTHAPSLQPATLSHASPSGIALRTHPGSITLTTTPVLRVRTVASQQPGELVLPHAPDFGPRLQRGSMPVRTRSHASASDLRPRTRSGPMPSSPPWDANTRDVRTPHSGSAQLRLRTTGAPPQPVQLTHASLPAFAALTTADWAQATSLTHPGTADLPALAPSGATGPLAQATPPDSVQRITPGRKAAPEFAANLRNGSVELLHPGTPHGAPEQRPLTHRSTLRARTLAMPFDPRATTFSSASDFRTLTHPDTPDFEPPARSARAGQPDMLRILHRDAPALGAGIGSREIVRSGWTPLVLTPSAPTAESAPQPPTRPGPPPAPMRPIAPQHSSFAATGRVARLPADTASETVPPTWPLDPSTLTGSETRRLAEALAVQLEKRDRLRDVRRARR